jgi:hypothetical protein
MLIDIKYFFLNILKDRSFILVWYNKRSLIFFLIPSPKFKIRKSMNRYIFKIFLLYFKKLQFERRPHLIIIAPAKNEYGWLEVNLTAAASIESKPPKSSK